MNSAARILGLVAAGAVLLGVDAATAPANAQDACKSERVTAKSEIRVRGETFATNEAKQKWERLAEERFGKSFGRWANAKDTNVECESAKSPTVGLPAKVCTAYGRPCSRDERAEEREGDGKRAKTGRRHERDGDWDRRGDRSDRLGAIYRRAYDAEMRRQDYLAKRRRQAEQWAERREMAYYRRLYRRWSNAGYWD